MARTLNLEFLEFLEAAPQKAVVSLPDRSEYRNHVGGPHAGAMLSSVYRPPREIGSTQSRCSGVPEAPQ